MRIAMTTPKTRLIASFVVFSSTLLLLSACMQASDPTIHLDGSTMGTTYHITIPQPPATVSAEQLKTEIDAILVTVNQQMSTYIADSQISTFNQLGTDEWMQVDPDFIQVAQAGIQLSEQSNGKFDITIGPLIELWGFGKGWHNNIPSDQAIQAAKSKTGWQHLQIDVTNSALLKDIPLTLNLSAIAKGFGVDKVADHLATTHNINNYLVEIGGEVRVKGKNPKGKTWSLGIEKPSESAQAVQQIIKIDNKAVATSGDYRNYFEIDGKRYSHTIDPSTGKPVKHLIGSVTVITDSAMMADGYATTLNVIGNIDDAMALAERQKLAAYFILYNDDEATPYLTRHSTAFKPYLK